MAQPLSGWRRLYLDHRKASSGELDPKPGQAKTARDRTLDLAADLVTVLAEIKAKRWALAMARGWRRVEP